MKLRFIPPILLLGIIAIGAFRTWDRRVAASSAWEGSPNAAQRKVGRAKAPPPVTSPEVAPPSPVNEVRVRLAMAASRFSDPVEREAFLQAAVRGVPRAFYARLIESMISAEAGSVDAEIVRAILLRWAWEEPTNVAAWAIDHPTHTVRQEALALAAERWVKSNPTQLLQWAAGLSGADRQWVLLRSGDFLGRTDPALFAVWQQAIQPGRERDQLEVAIGRAWAAREPADVAAALVANAGPEFDDWRRLTLSGLTAHLAAMKGPDAAQFVTEKIPPGTDRQSATMGAVVAWAREDPTATKQWIETFPSDELRAQASQVLLGYWLESDRAAAEAFAASLPVGIVSDRASERVAQFFAGKSDEEAVAWAERIDEPSRKSNTLAYVIAEWERHDPDAVRSLLHEGRK